MVLAAMAGRNWTTRYHNLFSDHHGKPPPATLGILAFDAAKTMCRLVSLYKSLTDDEIAHLRNDVIKSKGVVYLNSHDECFLLNLACAERLEELNLAAVTVARLGRKCSDFDLHSFDVVYADLRLGFFDLRKLQFKTRNVQRIVEKVEKLVSSTGNLHNAMESLTHMEASEKRIQRWKTFGVQRGSRPSMEHLYDKMKIQRKQVQHYKEVSLWNQTFDKAVGLMAQIVYIVYARIFSIFGPYVSDTSYFNKKHIRSISEDCCCIRHRELYQTNRRLAMQIRVSKSGPMPKVRKTSLIRSHKSPLSGPVGSNEIVQNIGVFKMAAPSTVGGSGLSLRYANVILFAERCLHAPATIGADAREALYEMLPERLKGQVRRKLKRHWMNGREDGLEGADGHWLAEGWREAVEELMEWLSPVAHDTVRWAAERNQEKQRLEAKPTVLLLQTLHFSDLEKAEAAIVEVLVGLSCIYWYEQFRSYCEPKCKR